MILAAAPPSWSATPSHCSVASMGSPHPVQLNLRLSKRLIMRHTSSKVRDLDLFVFGEEERTHVQPSCDGTVKRKSTAFLLGAVFGASLLAIRHSLRIEHASD